MSWLFQEMRNYLIKKKDIPMNGEKHTALLDLVESFYHNRRQTVVTVLY